MNTALQANLRVLQWGLMLSLIPCCVATYFGLWIFGCLWVGAMLAFIVTAG